jgi:hypothetical protein
MKTYLWLVTFTPAVGEGEKILKNDTLEQVNNSASLGKKGREREIINSSIRGAPHAPKP